MNICLSIYLCVYLSVYLSGCLFILYYIKSRYAVHLCCQCTIYRVHICMYVCKYVWCMYVWRMYDVCMYVYIYTYMYTLYSNGTDLRLLPAASSRAAAPSAPPVRLPSVFIWGGLAVGAFKITGLLHMWAYSATHMYLYLSIYMIYIERERTAQRICIYIYLSTCVYIYRNRAYSATYMYLYLSI